jgi:hypothetical protein
MNIDWEKTNSNIDYLDQFIREWLDRHPDADLTVSKYLQLYFVVFLEDGEFSYPRWDTNV